MSSFLVIDDDRESSAVLARALLEKGFEVRVVRSEHEATSALAERPADVVVAKADLQLAADRELLERMRAHLPSAATVVLAAEPTPADRTVAEDLGLAAVVGRSALEAELDAAIARACEATTGFRGSLHGLDLHDVLQMFNLNRRTLSVYVGGRAAGRIDFEVGDIVHAVSGVLSGAEALTAMLSSSSGSVRTAPRVDAERSIHSEFAAVMLETVQRVDETIRSHGTGELLPVPPPVLDDATLDARLALLDRPSVTPSYEGSVSDVWASSLPELASVLPMTPTLASGGAVLNLVSAPPRRSDALCAALLAEIAGALAVAVVDVSSAELVGAELAIPLDRAFARDWGQYFATLFGGPDAGALAARLDDGTYVEEAHLSTRHGQLLGRALSGGTHALLVMLARNGDVAGAWASIRKLVRGVESNL